MLANGYGDARRLLVIALLALFVASRLVIVLLGASGSMDWAELEVDALVGGVVEPILGDLDGVVPDGDFGAIDALAGGVVEPILGELDGAYGAADACWSGVAFGAVDALVGGVVEDVAFVAFGDMVLAFVAFGDVVPSIIEFAVDAPGGGVAGREVVDALGVGVAREVVDALGVGVAESSFVAVVDDVLLCELTVPCDCTVTCCIAYLCLPHRYMLIYQCFVSSMSVIAAMCLHSASSCPPSHAYFLMLGLLRAILNLHSANSGNRHLTLTSIIEFSTFSARLSKKDKDYHVYSNRDAQEP